MPGDNDKFLLILEKISEVSERTARMEVKQDQMEEDIKFIKNEDAKQNQLLAEHIQGTVTNRERLEIERKNREDLENKVNNQETRIQKLEEPKKFLSQLKQVLLWIVAVGGSVMAIYGWFK